MGIAVVAPTTYVAPNGGACGSSAGVCGTFINAPCGSGAGLGTGDNSVGTAASNTATMASVMNPLSQAAAATAPYVVQGTQALAGGSAANLGTGQLATTNSAITAATRGEANYVAGSDYSKKTPTGCIGPDVYFSNPIATIASSKKMVYTFCNPDGYKGVAVTGNTLAENINLYTQANGQAAHSSGDGKTAKTVANIGLDNPALTELLEGQAFYAALAP